MWSPATISNPVAMAADDDSIGLQIVKEKGISFWS
jgi:hypothetical protein